MPCDRTRKDDVRESARSIMCDVRCLCNTACMISENQQPHRRQPSLACFPPAMHASSIHCLKMTIAGIVRLLLLSEYLSRYAEARRLSSQCSYTKSLLFLLLLGKKLKHVDKILNLPVTGYYISCPPVRLFQLTCPGFYVGLSFLSA